MWQYVREHGVLQFMNKYQQKKDLAGCELLWGDEIEYGIFALDRKARIPRLSLRASEVNHISQLHIAPV